MISLLADEERPNGRQKEWQGVEEVGG